MPSDTCSIDYSFCPHFTFYRLTSVHAGGHREADIDLEPACTRVPQHAPTHGRTRRTHRAHTGHPSQHFYLRTCAHLIQ